MPTLDNLQIMGNKQKNAKGWAHLPPELLHIISQQVFMLQYEQITTPVDNCYADTYNRLRALSAARAFDSLSFVCSRWYSAMATCTFWDNLTRYIYGADEKMLETLLRTWFNSPRSQQLITRAHFHHARSLVCAVCVAYSRRLNFALTGATSYSFAAGEIAICKWHEQHGFCGVCLKDDTVLREEPPEYQSTLSPVDDEDTYFSSLVYTCEQCRTDACRSQMRQHKLNLSIAQAVDMDELFSNYQAFGEGSVQSLCIQVQERRWLAVNTKIKDFSLQAVAADRLLRGMPMAEAMNSDPEDAVVMYSDPSIRELAMRDFMRTHILGGGWFAPVDILELSQNRYRLPFYWQGAQAIPTPVYHPIRGERQVATWFYVIPSYDFQEILQSLWHQTMVDILETAFKNIIAEVTDSCLVDSKVFEFDNQEPAPWRISDPGQRLQSWTMEDVWDRLLKQEYWVTGYNWRSRKLAELRARRISDASSSASSESATFTESPDGTNSTSKTTPSPPPAAQSKDAKSPEFVAATTTTSDVSKSPRSPIPDMPELEVTGVEARQVQSVPFVPLNWGVLPQYTRQWITNLWIKSIHPFVACQCGICKRACQIQEEERLRGSQRKAPTGGIVINEPPARKAEQETDDVDLMYQMESDDEEDESFARDPSDLPMEEVTAEADDRAANDQTPIQLVQHPATPPYSDTPDPASMLSTPSTGATNVTISRVSGNDPTTPVGSLSPPFCRKRASQELESMPSTPSSAAKRRRLDLEEFKGSSPSPAVSPTDDASSSPDLTNTSENVTPLSSMMATLTTYLPLKSHPETPKGFVKADVEDGLLDFAREGVDADKSTAQTQTSSMQWQQ